MSKGNHTVFCEYVFLNGLKLKRYVEIVQVVTFINIPEEHPPFPYQSQLFRYRLCNHLQECGLQNFLLLLNEVKDPTEPPVSILKVTVLVTMHYYKISNVDFISQLF